VLELFCGAVGNQHRSQTKGEEHMTIEEAWMFWMKTRSTTEPPTVTDFDVIKKSSHWAAFEAGWHAAHCNSDGWHSAYNLGLEAGKQIRTHTPEDIKEITSKWA
jgi:hypothetical protein